MTTCEHVRSNVIERKELRTSGSLTEYLNGFLELSRNPLYTKELKDGVKGMLTTLAGFENKDENNGMMLTGSLARYIAGNGDPMTNWHIREKAKEAADKATTEWVRKDLLKIANPDQDIDTVFNFTNGNTLADLYTYLSQQFPNGTTKKETVWENQLPSDENCLKTYMFTDKNGIGVQVEIGPIKTNPNITHMAIGFYENNARLFHIDIADYPKTGSQAKDQKRQGGLTIIAQDLLIPLHHNKAKTDVLYKINKKGIVDLNFKERIRYDKDTTGETEKDTGDVFELAARALRIHLIHSEKLFEEKSAQSLTKLFFTDELFDIRKRLQDFVCNGNELDSNKRKLITTELLISIILDPIETAKFLQDTGLYFLLPGMSEFNHQDWKNFYNADAFAVLDPGVPLPDKVTRRSLANVGENQEKLQKIRWNRGINGALLFFEAYGEAMKHHLSGIVTKNIDQTYSLALDKQFHTTHSRVISAKHTLSSTIPTVLKCFPSGLTEKEMHSIIERQTGIKITRTIFKRALFEAKSLGYIDHQNRMPSDQVIEKIPTISFYSPRMNNQGELETTLLLLNEQSIATKIATLEFQDISDQTATVTLKKYLMNLSAHSIESFRPMKKFDIKLLTNEMRRTLQSNNEEPILRDTIYRFFKGIHKFCVEYSRQRGL